MSKNYLLPLLLSAALLGGCESRQPQGSTGEPAESGSAADTSQSGTNKGLAARPGIQPVNLPDPGIPGFAFPQDSSTINQWIASGNAAAISQHGWGIWTALATKTGQVYNGDSLRVFETWHTKHEVDSLINSTAPAEKSRTLLARRPPKLTRRLNRPRQFNRDPQLISRLKAKASPHTMAVAADEDAVFESVSYDPSAASVITNGRLFWASTLQGMLDRQQADIPDFPASAIAIKPVYEVVPGPKRSKGLYKMKVWTGGPATPQAFGQAKWSSCVYVDIQGRGQGSGAVSPGCGAATPATTYKLSDFVHYTLTGAEAAAMDSSGQVSGAQAGDYVILVAMHITTKEIKRWTWQTMWWAPDPNRAPAPSSPAVVAARPAQLRGAARHYAMAIAYQMIDPVQPFSGGNNKGKSIYVFNPYLEAGFGPSTFNNAGHLREKSDVVTNGLVVVNNVGVRTNCMSCHAQASFNPAASKALPLGYLGDTYVDMQAPKFKGKLRTDFLWSIADMASSPPDAQR